MEFLEHLGEGFLGSLLVLCIWLVDKYRARKKDNLEISSLKTSIANDVVEQITQVHEAQLKLKDEQINVLKEEKETLLIKINSLIKKVEILDAHVKDLTKEIRIKEETIQDQNKYITELENKTSI